MAPNRILTLLAAALLLAVPLPAQGGLSAGFPTRYLGHSVFFDAGMSSAPLSSLTLDDLGRCYLLASDGRIKVLVDSNQDRVVDQVTDFNPGWAAVAPPALGILWFQGSIYVNHLGVLTRFTDTNSDLVADVITDLVTGLPYGWHQNNGLFTDGTYLYFGLGTTTDHDVEADPRSGTLQRYDPQTGQLSTYATGLRNVFDGVYVQGLGEIYVGDNGPNLVTGNPDPPDEIDRVLAGRDYGHPNHWGTPPPGTAGDAPVLDLPSHVSPTGFDVNPCTAFSGYRNELWFTTFGGTTTSLSRVPLIRNAQTQAVTGVLEFLLAQGAISYGSLAALKLIDLRFLPNGELLVLDYVGRKVWAVYPTTGARIVVEGDSTVGGTCLIRLAAPARPGALAYTAASEYALGVPWSIPGGFQIDLDLASPLFTFSVTPSNGIFFFPQFAPLDAQGEALGAIVIPNLPALAGFALRLQWIVLDPLSGLVVDVSAPQGLFIAP